MALRLRSWKRGDCVRFGKSDRDPVGVVLRVARDGRWADVLWIQSNDNGDASWTKRQPDASLLRRATPDQRNLVGVWFALQEAVAAGYLERVSA
jgi:hypothetical protein